MKNRENRKSMPRLLAAALAAVLILGVLPVQAFAVTQAETGGLARRKEATGPSCGSGGGAGWELKTQDCRKSRQAKAG